MAMLLKSISFGQMIFRRLVNHNSDGYLNALWPDLPVLVDGSYSLFQKCLMVLRLGFSLDRLCLWTHTQDIGTMVMLFRALPPYRSSLGLHGSKQTLPKISVGSRTCLPYLLMYEEEASGDSSSTYILFWKDL
jgi:hypothetical protein